MTCTIAAPAYAGQNSNDEDNDYKPTAEQLIIDGLIFRPLYLAGTIVGTGVFIVTLPFSLLGGNVGDAGEKLIIEPANATFNNCLGCITDYTGSRTR
ncbi:MAG: multidrug transporter [Gammaproteobacteria bacterium]